MNLLILGKEQLPSYFVKWDVFRILYFKLNKNVIHIRKATFSFGRIRKAAFVSSWYDQGAPNGKIGNIARIYLKRIQISIMQTTGQYNTHIRIKMNSDLIGRRNKKYNWYQYQMFFTFCIRDYVLMGTFEAFHHIKDIEYKHLELHILDPTDPCRV